MKLVTSTFMRVSMLFAGLTFTSAAFVNCSIGKFDVASGSKAGVPYGSETTEASEQPTMFTDTNQNSPTTPASSGSASANGSTAVGGSMASASGNSTSLNSTTGSNGSESATNLKVTIDFFSVVNGVSTTDMYIDQVIYGIVKNSSKEATYGCATLVERLASGGCADESQWVKLPNQEWSFDDVKQAWVMTKNISYFMPPDKQGIMFLHDRLNNRRATSYLYLKSRPNVAVQYFYTGVVFGPCQKSPQLLSMEASGACNANTLGQQYQDITNTEVSCRATYTCVSN